MSRQTVREGFPGKITDKMNYDSGYALFKSSVVQVLNITGFENTKKLENETWFPDSLVPCSLNGLWGA